MSESKNSWLKKEVVGPLLVAAILAAVTFLRKNDVAQADASNLRDVVYGHSAEIRDHDKKLSEHEVALATIKTDLGYMKRGIDELLDRKRGR